MKANFKRPLFNIESYLKNYEADDFHERTGYRRVHLIDLADLHTKLDRPGVAESLFHSKLIENS